MKLCEKHHHLLTGEGECLACKHSELLDYLEKLKADHRKQIEGLKAQIAQYSQGLERGVDAQT